MFLRKLTLPPPGSETFFLWGPRQTGKSTLLRERYPDAVWIDLVLGPHEFARRLWSGDLIGDPFLQRRP
jgi:hypothetical protein